MLKEKINDYENTFFLDDISNQQQTPNNIVANPLIKEAPKSAKKLAKAKKNTNKLKRLKKHKVKTTTTKKYDNLVYDDVETNQDELEFSINDKVSNTHNKKRKYKKKPFANYE